MVIICWSSQKTINLLISVFMKSGEHHPESAVMGLLIQVKQHEVEGSTKQYKIDQKDLNFFLDLANDVANLYPYVTLVTKLGVQLPIPLSPKLGVQLPIPLSPKLGVQLPIPLFPKLVVSIGTVYGTSAV